MFKLFDTRILCNLATNFSTQILKLPPRTMPENYHYSTETIFAETLVSDIHEQGT